MSALNAPRERVTPREPINETEQRFARTSRTRTPISDTDDEHRPLEAGHEVAIYAACVVALIVLVLIW